MEMEPGDEYNPYKTQKPIPAERKSLENLAENVFQQNALKNPNYHGSVHDTSQNMSSQGSPNNYQGLHHEPQRHPLQNNGSQRNLFNGNREDYTVVHGSQSLPRQNHPAPSEDDYLSPDNSYTVRFYLRFVFTRTQK